MKQKLIFLGDILTNHPVITYYFISMILPLVNFDWSEHLSYNQLNKAGGFLIIKLQELIISVPE